MGVRVGPWTVHSLRDAALLATVLPRWPIPWDQLTALHDHDPVPLDVPAASHERLTAAAVLPASYADVDPQRLVDGEREAFQAVSGAILDAHTDRFGPPEPTRQQQLEQRFADAEQLSADLAGQIGAMRDRVAAVEAISDEARKLRDAITGPNPDRGRT